MAEQSGAKGGHNPLVVGVTGGPGSGKSTVTRMLAAMGAQTADADALVRWAYRDASFRRAIVRRFGNGVLNPEGGIDRRALAEIVFSDEAALDDLEHMVHPAVLHQMAEMVTVYQTDPERAPMLALEIPLLFETGAEAMVDRVLVVRASPDVLARRLSDRGWSDERIAAVHQSQWPLEEKVERADDVIDTDGSVEETAAQVESLWSRLVGPADSTGSSESV